MRGFIDGEETPFDFNRLIPMPPELGRAIADYGTAYDVYYGNAERVLEYASVKNLKIETVEQLREHFDATPLHRAIANQYKANIEKYGVPTWYEWSCENWNTKWNACDAELTENRDGSIQFNFDTAWSFAYPIFEKLVANFPMLDFEGTAQEPNMGMFTIFVGRNGELTCDDDHEASEAADALYQEQYESPEVTA